MKFTLVVHTAPYSADGSYSALQFARALLESGNSIYRLFFYRDGVHNATTLGVAPQDELDLPAAWRELIERHQLDAVVCIAAALKRGVLDASEARRYERPSHNLAIGFELSGLGQLLDAAVHSDRVITFGG